MKTPQPKANQPRLRILRRALGLTQEALAVLIGKSQSQVARIEDGSQQPTFIEGLIIELILGAPATEIFPALRSSARRQLLRRLRELKTKRIPPVSARSAFTIAQLDHITASLEFRDEASFGVHTNWHTKHFLDWVERYL